MTARPVSEGPCWALLPELLEAESARHFLTEAEAMLAGAYWLNDLYDDLFTEDPETFEEWCRGSLVMQEGGPCVRLVCDRCGRAATDNDGVMVAAEHGAHFAGDELDGFVLDWLDWVIDRETGGDYCPECEAETTPEQARARLEAEARVPGPNDVPMFAVDL